MTLESKNGNGYPSGKFMQKFDCFSAKQNLCKLIFILL